MTIIMKKLLLSLAALFVGYAASAQIVYSTDFKGEAKVKVYVTEFKGEADIKVYFTEFKGEAGWQKKSKMHLMY